MMFSIKIGILQQFLLMCDRTFRGVYIYILPSCKKSTRNFNMVCEPLYEPMIYAYMWRTVLTVCMIYKQNATLVTYRTTIPTCISSILDAHQLPAVADANPIWLLISKPFHV